MSGGNDDPGVEIAGFLYKRRGGFGKHMPNCWQLRYFTISNGILNYYDSIEDSKPRGRLDLTSDKLTFSVGTIIDNSPTIYTIQLIPYPVESEKWKLCTESKQELKRWTNCMEKYIEGEGRRPRGASLPPLANFESNRLMIPPLDDDDDDERDLVESSSPPPKPSRPLTLPERNTNITEIIKTNTSDKTQQPSRASMPILRSNTNFNKSSPVIKPTPTTSSSVPSTTTKSKKRLKLKSSENAIKPEQFESIMVFIIMNSCFIMALTSSIVMSLIYLSIANIVVGRTLLLRATRIATNIPSVTPEITKNNSKNSNKNITKRNGVYDDGETIETVTVQTTDNTTTTITTAGATTTMTNGTNDTNQSTVISSTGERIVSKSKVRFEEEDILTGTDAATEPLLQASITTTTTTTTTMGVTDPMANIKPIVGSTLSQVYTIPPNVPEHTWRRCDHKQFNVRVGPEYNRYKKKAPSGNPIYEAIAVDVFCTKERVDFVSQRMTLPDASDMNTHHPFVPPLFVIQIQIPSEPPPVFGSVEDGPGWAIVMTYKITKESCEQLKDMSTASPAIRLFAQWCERAPVDPTWRGRFKVINSCLNLEELGMPQVVMSYNAKPVLIRRTGTLFRGVGLLEMDIHVHKFASLAKRSIHLISSKCGLMYMQIGFVIEGREESELPETLFACVGVNRPQEDRADFLFEPDDDEDDGNND